MIAAYRLSYLLLASCLLWMGAPSLSQTALTVDQQVDVIQARFHFKDPNTGADISHANLKQALLLPRGSGTYLEPGRAIVMQMDAKAKYDRNLFTDFGADIISLVWDSYALVYNLPATWADVGLGYVVGQIGDYCPRFSFIYDRWGDWKTLSGQNLQGLVNKYLKAWTDILENEAVRNYIAVVVDPDNDAEEWSMVIESVLGVPNSDQFHAFCRTTWKNNRDLQDNLPARMDKFRTDVNSLLTGSVNIDGTPDPWYLNAPVTVTFNANGSVGSYHSYITGYRWHLDTQDMGSASTFQTTFWAPGSHNVSAVLTDGNTNVLSGSRSVFVDGPRIISGAYDKAHFVAALSTPANPLVSNYAWDFGDGSEVHSGPNLTGVTHTWPGLNSYKVTLTETTTDGETVSSTTTVAFQHIPTDIPGGTVLGTQTWDVDGSPYRIHGAVSVATGARLTLQPGVVLQFDQNANLNVAGQIVSNGQSSLAGRVYLTSYRDGSGPGIGGTDAGAQGDWQGLTIVTGGSLSLVGTVIKYAATGVSGTITRVSDATFDHCRVGMQVADTNVNYRSTPLAVTDCVFQACAYGLLDAARAPLTVTGCTFQSSFYQAINVSGDPGAATAPDVTLTANTFVNEGSSDPVHFGGIFGTLAFSGNQPTGSAIPFTLDDVTLTKDTTWSLQPNVRLVENSTLTVASGATLNLQAGMAIQFNRINYYKCRLQVNGALATTGTAQTPVVLTVPTDNSPYGGTDVTTSQRWDGVYYGAASTADLGCIVVRYADGIVGPYSVSDLRRALRVAGGITAATTTDLLRNDVDKGTASAGCVNLLDAMRVARKAAGLDPNP